MNLTHACTSIYTHVVPLLSSLNTITPLLNFFNYFIPNGLLFILFRHNLLVAFHTSSHSWNSTHTQHFPPPPPLPTPSLLSSLPFLDPLSWRPGLEKWPHPNGPGHNTWTQRCPHIWQLIQLEPRLGSSHSCFPGSLPSRQTAHGFQPGLRPSRHHLRPSHCPRDPYVAPFC